MDSAFIRLRFLWCCSILGYHFSFRFLATLLPTTTFPSIFSIFNMLLKLSFWIEWCITLFTFIRGSSSWHHLVFHHTILFMPCFSKLLCLLFQVSVLLVVYLQKTSIIKFSSLWRLNLIWSTFCSLIFEGFNIPFKFIKKSYDPFIIPLVL